MSKSTIVFFLLAAYTSIRSFTDPWIGLVTYVGFVVLIPSWNWRWSWLSETGGWIDQKTFAVPTLIGTLLSGQISNRQCATAKLSLWALTGFLVLSFISTFQSVLPLISWRFMDLFWKIWIMCIATCLLIRTEKMFNILVWVAVCGQSWNCYNINELYYKWGIRIDSFSWAGQDNNTYAIMTLPMGFLAMSVAIVSKRIWVKAISGLFFVLAMHEIMILQSRGTMIGGIVGFFLAFVFMPKTRMSVLAFVIAVVCGSILAGPSVVQEFNSSFKSSDELDSSASSRYMLWRAGYEIGMENFLLGVGPSASRVVVPRYTKTGMSYKALHNLFFEVWTGSGAPALVLYLCFFGIPWFMHFLIWVRGGVGESWSFRVANLAVLAGVPGYWAASMFSAGALLEPSYLLVAFGLAALNIREFGDTSTDGALAVQIDEGEDLDLDEEEFLDEVTTADVETPASR